MKKIKAYSYVRMSTVEQLKGDSRRRQLALTEKYAREKNLELVERFDDWGVSAYRGRNVEFGALNRFITLIESGEVERGSYLIVESMDRLSREKGLKALGLLSQIVNRGINLVTLDDGQIYSEESFERNQFTLILALGAMARAHEESRRKSGLLSEVWSEKKRKARHSRTIMTRRMPAWLQLDEAANRIVVNEKRVKVIREIFTMVRDGWGAYSVSRQLNARGEMPWSERKHAVWRESYIKKIIASRTVLGEYAPHKIVHDANRKALRVPDGEAVRNYYPIVISEGLFREAQAAMSRRRLGGRGRKGAKYSNLFTGLLKCRCGAGYRYIDKGAPPKGGQYLQCSVAFARGKCSIPPFRYQTIESTILHVIESLDVGKVLGGGSRQQRLEETRDELGKTKSELERIASQIARVVAVITDGDGTKSPSLLLKLHELEVQQSSREFLCEKLEIEIAELTQLDPKKRRHIIRKLLTEIRSPDGTPQNETTRRALASELQRMIDGIVVEPDVRLAHETAEADPNWQKTYKVNSLRELQKILREFSFQLSVHYRSGDRHVVDPLKGIYLRLKGNMRLKNWKFISE